MEDIVTRFKQGIVALLLAASVVLTAAEAYAKPPALCAAIGCIQGPDTCLKMSIRVGFAEMAFTCYTKIASR
jgi:hypothetical protein